MSESQKEVVGHIEEAIDNEWPLRPVKGKRFINIDYAEGIELKDRSHILSDEVKLVDFPSGITAVALIPYFIEDFVCLDLDFKDDDLKNKIWATLSMYKKEEMFLRYGDKEKFGQLWFKSYDSVNYCSYKGIDIITTQKRCDALGAYKGGEYITYEWPYQKFWEHTPDDLPYISDALIQEITEIVNEFHGEKTTKKRNLGSRHDQLVEMARLGIAAKRPMDDILDDMYGSEAYKSLLGEKGRDPSGEVANALSWAVKNKAKTWFKWDIKDKENVEDQIYSVPNEAPTVEKHSLFDMLYKAVRRNQVIENKRMAMATTLSLCSWMLSLCARFQGMAPNLMMLLIAPSGSGKSTTSRAIKEIIKLEKRLQKSYCGQDIRTDSAIFSSVEQSPIAYYAIDEATKIMKSANTKGSHNANVGEILSQLYSDFRDTDPPQALARLKSECYGVAIGAKVNTIMFSTPEFWKVFNESHFTQGFGRRLFIIISNQLPLQKVGKEYNPDFFTDEEKKLIKFFLDSYLGKDEQIYEEVDISSYKIIESISTDKGIKTIKHYQKCLKPKITLPMTANAETKEYLKNDFVRENNENKSKAMGSGSTIQQYMANSRAEFILKLSMIHTVCGKSMAPTKNGTDAMQMNIRSVIGMDSIKWATDMHSYYMYGSTLDQIDSVFHKDIVMDRNKEIKAKFLEKLSTEEKKVFTKSENIVKNFFRKIGGIDMRDKILVELIATNKIKVVGDGEYDGRGVSLEVIT